MAQTFDKIDSSDYFVSIYNDDYSRSVSCLAQIGYAIVKDKPIGLLVPHGARLSKHLINVASEIEFYERDNEGSLEDSTRRLVKRMMRDE